jgi:hypothetical protein
MKSYACNAYNASRKEVAYERKRYMKISFLTLQVCLGFATSFRISRS